MSTINNGGPAFPESGPRGRAIGGEGMSLRDYFAAKALQGLLANPGGAIQQNGMSGWGWCNCTVDDVAEFAWHIADAMLKAQVDGWQPIETAPKPDIGTNGFGERLLLVVDCGDGTTPSVRKGYWEGTDWYLECCGGLATEYGYRVTHWRPLPAPPTTTRRAGSISKETSND